MGFLQNAPSQISENVGSNKPAGQKNRYVSGGYLVWKCQSWRTVFKTNRGNSSLASRVIIIDKPFLTLGWKSHAAGCIFYSRYLLLNAHFESKMAINRYLRCLFGHKKVIVDILRSSFIGSLTLCHYKLYTNADRVVCDAICMLDPKDQTVMSITNAK